MQTDVLAYLRSDYVFNNYGCHVLVFSYHARGPNLGTLTVSYEQQGSSEQVELWTFDGISRDGWQSEELRFSNAKPIRVTVCTA